MISYRMTLTPGRADTRTRMSEGSITAAPPGRNAGFRKR